MTEAASDRSHLDASGPLRWNLRAQTDAARAAIDGLVERLEEVEAQAGKRTRKRKAADRQRLWVTMEAMTLGLFNAYASPRPWRGYPRGKEELSHFPDHSEVTGTTVATIADFLVREGLADARRGGFDKEYGRGLRSRLKATSALYSLLAVERGLTAVDIVSAPVNMPVQLRGAKDANGRKPLLPFDKKPAIEAAEQRVLDGNALRASCDISLEGGWAFADREEQADDVAAERADPTDRYAVHLYRVFSEGGFRSGGRFYGGFWQALRKADRKRLLIDGEETVELDFQACHIRMCYQIDGAPLPADYDPYTIPGIAPQHRGAVKGLLLRWLGSGPSSRIRRPEALADWSRKDYDRFRQRITDAHPQITSWTRAGHWATLQWFDSRIADAIMADLTAQGIPCLPVHDSFIVPLSAEQAARDAMVKGWCGVMAEEGAAKADPVITGGSSKGGARAPCPQPSLPQPRS
ncbi:MAG TPA: hypothetical protein VF503_27750 [Sphingobium sp.]|uniref:hypothetical protein n=1 Tax=Sphingobium sp. TaxID=1912891 RepID=UPI002ED400DA